MFGGRKSGGCRVIKGGFLGRPCSLSLHAEAMKSRFGAAITAGRFVIDSRLKSFIHMSLQMRSLRNMVEKYAFHASSFNCQHARMGRPIRYLDVSPVCRPLPAYARAAFVFNSRGTLHACRGERTPPSRIVCGFVWCGCAARRLSHAQADCRPSDDAGRPGLHSGSSMVWKQASIACDGSNDHILRQRIYDRRAPDEPHVLHVVRMFFEVLIGAFTSAGLLLRF